MDYIDDKKLYAAVMFASKLVAETGYFFKACRTAADYYGVSADDVAQYVRQRQSDGQKGQSRKYHWYCIHGHMASERGAVNDYERELGRWRLVKASSESNAIKQLQGQDSYHEYGSQFVWGDVKEFQSHNAAHKFITTCEAPHDGR